MSLANLAFIRPNQFRDSFSEAFNEFERHLSGTQSKYPPHDVLRINDNQYQVVLAIAGFSKKDISVTVEDSVLTITGTKVKTVADGETAPVYIYNGISHKSFKKTFTLQSTIRVTGAKVEDGLLTIDLEEIIPDTKKPVTIAIE